MQHPQEHPREHPTDRPGDHHDVLVVGGGNAGISLAARLLRDGAGDVAVVESEAVHRYRPLLSYVAAGEATMADLERPAADVMPGGVTWIPERVAAVDPEGADGPVLTTASGRRISCTTLVLCPGLEEDWEATPGLREAYAAGWAGSSFVVETAPRVWPALRDLTSGRVLFTVPPEPAPCGATALKPLLMACDHWQRAGVLGDLDVVLVLPGSSPLVLAEADAELDRVLDSYGVRVLREARVTGLEGRAVRVATAAGEQVVDDVAFAHVVPHYRAAAWVAEAGLSGKDPAGRVEVDPSTLRHPRYPQVWALGDAADLGIRPSGGALRKQVAVLAPNIRAVSRGGALERYDGYTVMPVTTGRRRLMFVEVDRAGRREPTVRFPDLVRPRRTSWWVDRHALPQTYFRRILRGKV
ncbi:NAD(P)/FAD-dependent oxidoreductase [Nocardioides solisilvae]|uniref:NAD(P)/FAD-dependent oxidoreductase n=1 Tax=Nocardioides solisilvae TaxID=1542435 RepID=UPI000D742BDB|nr:FAD/NAD(P)-binding oxidoreductase [Nocardioides solisilvae]